MNILFSKEHDEEHDDMSTLYWVQTLQLWLTFCLQSKEDQNHTASKSIDVVTSIKCGY